MENKKVINKDQRQQLDRCGTQTEANTKFKEFLLNDPTPDTLLAAADVLETAPDTPNMNKKFAKAIRQFLLSEGIYVFQLLTEYIIYYGLQNSETFVIFHCMCILFLYVSCKGTTTVQPESSGGNTESKKLPIPDC